MCGRSIEGTFHDPADASKLVVIGEKPYDFWYKRHRMPGRLMARAHLKCKDNERGGSISTKSVLRAAHELGFD